MASTSKDPEWLKYSAKMDEDPEIDRMLQLHYAEVVKQYEKGEREDSDVYDSEEEEEVLSKMSEEEKEMYQECQANFVRQLVTYGRTMNLSSEIRRHMFKWLPNCPNEYVARASAAVKKRRGGAAAVTPAPEVPAVTTEKTGEDVLVVKIVPAADPMCIKQFAVKEEAKVEEEGEEPKASTSAGTSAEADTTAAEEGDERCPRPPSPRKSSGGSCPTRATNYRLAQDGRVTA